MTVELLSVIPMTYAPFLLAKKRPLYNLTLYLSFDYSIVALFIHIKPSCTGRIGTLRGRGRVLYVGIEG
jgi:hypothetical protein